MTRDEETHRVVLVEIVPHGRQQLHALVHRHADQLPHTRELLRPALHGVQRIVRAILHEDVRRVDVRLDVELDDLQRLSSDLREERGAEPVLDVDDVDPELEEVEQRVGVGHVLRENGLREGESQLHDLRDEGIDVAADAGDVLVRSLRQAYHDAVEQLAEHVHGVGVVESVGVGEDREDAVEGDLAGGAAAAVGVGVHVGRAPHPQQHLHHQRGDGRRAAAVATRQRRARAVHVEEKRHVVVGEDVGDPGLGEKHHRQVVAGHLAAGHAAVEGETAEKKLKGVLKQLHPQLGSAHGGVVRLVGVRQHVEGESDDVHEVAVAELNGGLGFVHFAALWK